MSAPVRPEQSVAIAHGFIQVAGVSDAAEARLLVECGVRFLGFPLRLPVHREDLSEADAASIVRALPPAVHGVLITYLERAGDIVELARYLGTSVVQVHGEIEAQELIRLREIAPDLAVLKSLVVGRLPVGMLEAQVERLAPWVDAFITDSWDPSTGATGATGKTHDWAISRRLVECSPRPVILAGGLTADNVAQAIREVRAAGVDSHTGVEDGAGRKDRDKVARFVAAARNALAGLQ